jgi:lambda family phage portal protein
MPKQKPTLYIDRLIGWLNPVRGIRRVGARMMLETLSRKEKLSERAFEGISGSRLRHDWTNITQDADTANVTSLTELRNVLRDLRQNTGIISGPLKRITNYVIGTGLRPQAKARIDTEDQAIFLTQGISPITETIAQRFIYQSERAWRNWVDKADAQLRMNFYELQSLTFMAMFADGEVLAVARSSQKYQRTIPLCFEIIEIDRLATPPGEIANPKIRNGIEFDEEGVPIRYFVLKQHPGANYFIGKNLADYEPIDAFQGNGQRKVFHLYDILRPGQSRGYPPFASALEDIQDRKRYREAEVVAARVAACLAAFVKSPSAYTEFSNLNTNSSTEKMKEFQPGMIKYLQPGEEVQLFEPKRPNTNLPEFIKHMDREIANAADFPYEILTGDWGELNYSNARTIMILAYIAIRAYQQYFVDHFCYPAWELAMTDFVVKGLVEAPSFRERIKDYCNSQWIPPKRDWVDPQSESNAAKTDLETNVTTLSDLITGKGGDWEEQIEQRAKELAKIKELEKKYDISFSVQKQIAFPGGKGGDA